MNWLRRFFAAESGSIMVLAAFSLTAVMGMSGLAVELGNGYTVKVQHQRVADMAALAAALAYKNTQSAATLTSTAQDVAQANGLTRASTTASLSNDGTKVTVNVSGSVPLVLTRVLSNAVSLPVSNTAVASLVVTTTASAGCVMALSGSVTNGITMTGGVALNASGCAVMTNSGISLESSSTPITASAVSMGKTLTGQTSWITTTPANSVYQNKGNSFAADPLASDANLTAAFAKLGSYTDPLTVTAPAAPSTPTGTDWNLSSASSTPPAGVTLNKDANNAFTRWVATAGTYNIKTLTVGGGMTLTFQGSPTVTISAGVASTGNGIDFGKCTCKINGNFDAAYQTATFGDGSYEFGGNAALTGSKITIGNGKFTVTGTMSTNGTFTMGDGVHSFGTLSLGGSITFGNGDLTIANGLYMSYGNFKTGTGNVYIGRSASGVGLKMDSGSFTSGGGTYFSVAGPLVSGGGTTFSIGAADIRIGNDGSSNCTTLPNANCDSVTFGGSSLTFGNGAFSAKGNVKMTNSGTMTFGAAATHYIAGNLTVTGPLNFGAGEYVINGSLTNNTTGKMSGTDVTFILKGNLSLDGAAGLSLTAPTSSAGGGLANIVFATKTTTASLLTGGSNNIISGVLYMPKSDLTLSGGAHITSNNGCLTYIVNTLTLSGGTSAATSCSGMAGASTTSGSIALIQ